MFEIKHSNTPNKLQSDLKELSKIQVIFENLHEIKNEILRKYTGEFEKVSSLKVGDQIWQIHFRFRNSTDYEAYIISIDERYDAEDAICNCFFYKINTPQFNLVNRIQ